MLRTLTTAVTDGIDDDSSASSFSDSSTESLCGVLEDLAVDTTCLLDLEPLLCSPILRADPERAAILDTSQVTWRPHHAYSDKISERFPKAADDLVFRLGKASYERFVRCRDQRAKNELDAITTGQTAPAIFDNASSKFHDSGIGSSLPATASAYAATVMSYGIDRERRVRIPPLPARAKQGLPFACVACGKWVTIAQNSVWKQHIYGDLKPWVCLEADCGYSTDSFSTRNDWVSHLALEHEMAKWHMVDCPLCRDEIGPGEPSITRHLSQHLEEISLSALPADHEFDDESEGSKEHTEDDFTVAVQNPWMNGLVQFHKRLGRRIKSAPALDEKSLSLMDLENAVSAIGGYDRVNQSNAWGQVCVDLGFNVNNSVETILQLQRAYAEWIRPYEDSLHHEHERDGKPAIAKSEDFWPTLDTTDTKRGVGIQDPLESKSDDSSLTSTDASGGRFSREDSFTSNVAEANPPQQGEDSSTLVTTARDVPSQEHALQSRESSDNSPSKWYPGQPICNEYSRPSVQEAEENEVLNSEAPRAAQRGEQAAQHFGHRICYKL